MKAIAVIGAALLVVGGVASGQANASGPHRRHHHRHHQRPAHRARPAHPPKAASFDGSCTFSGAVKFTPKLTTSPQHVAQHADAPGSCTGTFVDHAGTPHQLQDAPVRDVADSAGDNVSCEFGLASGAGALEFQYGDLAFTMSEYRAGATPIIRLVGRAGGGAWMAVTPSQDADPVAALQACAAGGLDEFELDAHLQTDSPMRG